jgi:hypothetical protein
MDAAVKQKPLVKAAQATQLARRRAPIDAVLPQVFKKPSHIALHGRQQDAVPAFDEFGKGSQIA